MWATTPTTSLGETLCLAQYTKERFSWPAILDGLPEISPEFTGHALNFLV